MPGCQEASAIAELTKTGAGLRTRSVADLGKVWR
jgi:hypothetical protein